jgi:hypothetical protein
MLLFLEELHISPQGRVMGCEMSSFTPVGRWEVDDYGKEFAMHSGDTSHDWDHL